MTLDFFYNNYDLKNEYEVKKAYIKNNLLTLDVIVTAHLELIANGYRPELDVEHEIKFDFNVEHKDIVYKNPIIDDVLYDDSILKITINGELLVINDNNVVVTQTE